MPRDRPQGSQGTAFHTMTSPQSNYEMDQGPSSFSLALSKAFP